MLKEGNPAPVRETHVADEAASNLQGLKILIIDDSKTIRRTAETLLSKEGCTV
ncbi:MAG: response regulator, partial [Gammaproteobacteria bacterium]